jgi:hypothetical protein
MLIPEALSSHGTLGTIARQGGRGTIPGSQMPLSAGRSVLFPDWWGRPSSVSATNTPITRIGPQLAVEVNYNERTFYAGVVALLFAAIGLAARMDWRRKAPFALLAFIGIAIPLHMPGLYQLVEGLPVFELVQNQRLHFVFELAIAVLAAFGLQAMLDRPAGDRWRFAVAAAAVVVGLVVAAAAGPSGSDLEQVVTHFETGEDFHANHVIALTSIAWFLLFAIGVAGAVLAARRWPDRRRAVAVAVVLLGALDMLHFAHGYQPMGPASKVIPPRTPAIAYLQRHAADSRFIGLGFVLANDWSSTYGLDDVRGYDPPQPTARFYRLWLQANPAQIDWESFRIGSLEPTSLSIMSVLGARYLVTEPEVELTGSDARTRSALRVVYEGDDATVFENALAVPRAMVAPAVQVTSGEAATRAALAAGRFDPHRTVVVERDQPGVAGLSGVRGSASVVREQNAEVVMRASLARRGLVVLNDDFTDGWSVQVDGRPARALHVNDVMRGVAVGAGRHEVVWRYAVPGLRAGVWVSLLALAGVLGAAALLVLRSRRGVR